MLSVFPWILQVNAIKEEKRACPSLTPRRKKTTKSFCKVWASKFATTVGFKISDNCSYYNQEKWLKDNKASEKPIETTVKIRPRSLQASDKFATSPAPYKNQTKDFSESLL